MLNKILIAAALGGATLTAHAADNADKAIRDAIHALVPTAQIDSVDKSVLPGFYEVGIGHAVVYASADGKYLLQGNLYDMANKLDLTEARLAKSRKSVLDGVPVSKRIVFAPKTTKHVVTVFTDVDCPYCRKFHEQMADYNKAGIEVQYMLFPLSIHPGSDKKTVSVWCSTDRNAAWNAAMLGKDPGSKTCDNPIAETMKIGNDIGVNGTPSFYAEDGTQIQAQVAYSPPQLAAELDRIAAQKKVATSGGTQ
ncbi:DsbC family protein [Pseudolysobacter antarcticus]|nr:DsbC family protein [Pseudolysobacter antarcticus]